MIKRAFVKKLKFTWLDLRQFRKVRDVRMTKVKSNRRIRTKVNSFLLSGMIRRSIKTASNRYLTIVLECIGVK